MPRIMTVYVAPSDSYYNENCNLSTFHAIIDISDRLYLDAILYEQGQSNQVFIIFNFVVSGFL
jgi:hypothetical protein